MFEIDECVPTLYAILIFSVLILLSATGSEQNNNAAAVAIGYPPTAASATAFRFSRPFSK